MGCATSSSTAGVATGPLPDADISVTRDAIRVRGDMALRLGPSYRVPATAKPDGGRSVLVAPLARSLRQHLDTGETVSVAIAHDAPYRVVVDVLATLAASGYGHHHFVGLDRRWFVDGRLAHSAPTVSLSPSYAALRLTTVLETDGSVSVIGSGGQRQRYVALEGVTPLGALNDILGHLATTHRDQGVVLMVGAQPEVTWSSLTKLISALTTRLDGRAASRPLPLRVLAQVATGRRSLQFPRFTLVALPD